MQLRFNAVFFNFAKILIQYKMKIIFHRIPLLFIVMLAVICVRGETKLLVGEITPYALVVGLNVVDSETKENIEKVEFRVYPVDSNERVKLGFGPDVDPDNDNDEYFFQIQYPTPGAKYTLKFRNVNPEDYNDDRRERYENILARQGLYEERSVEFVVPNFDDCEQSIDSINGFRDGINKPLLLLHTQMGSPIELKKIK